MLRPSIEVVALRHDERRRATGKVAYRGVYTPAENDADLARTQRDLGLWLATSTHTVEETIDAILRWQSEALVP